MYTGTLIRAWASVARATGNSSRVAPPPVTRSMRRRRVAASRRTPGGLPDSRPRPFFSMYEDTPENHFVPMYFARLPEPRNKASGCVYTLGQPIPPLCQVGLISQDQLLGSSCAFATIWNYFASKFVNSCSTVVRGTMVNRSYVTPINLYFSLFLLTIFGPINYGPP